MDVRERRNLSPVQLRHVSIEIFQPPVSRRASRDDRKKICWRVIPLDFECGAGDAALANDRLQGSNPNLWMVWNGYGHRPKIASPLHDDVASALPNDLKTMLLKNTADVSPGEDAKLTHVPLRIE